MRWCAAMQVRAHAAGCTEVVRVMAFTCDACHAPHHGLFHAAACCSCNASADFGCLQVMSPELLPKFQGYGNAEQDVVTQHGHQRYIITPQARPHP
jgi:hypothetical protein